MSCACLSLGGVGHKQLVRLHCGAAEAWQHVGFWTGSQRMSPSRARAPLSRRAESDARRLGIQRLVLLTTRTADWFEQRGFAPAGAAHASALLPEERRARVDASRNSQLYSKELS